MSKRDKRQQDEVVEELAVELAIKENKEPEKVELKIVKKEERKMTFSVYFQGLIRLNPSIMPHHKAPMESFAKANGINNEASKTEFDKLFETY